MGRKHASLALGKPDRIPDGMRLVSLIADSTWTVLGQHRANLEGWGQGGSGIEEGGAVAEPSHRAWRVRARSSGGIWALWRGLWGGFKNALTTLRILQGWIAG